MYFATGVHGIGAIINAFDIIKTHSQIYILLVIYTHMRVLLTSYVFLNEWHASKFYISMKNQLLMFESLVSKELYLYIS